MEETEKQVLCLLLKQLQTRGLITREMYETAERKILDTWKEKGFFALRETEYKEESCGYSQNSDGNAPGEVDL